MVNLRRPSTLADAIFQTVAYADIFDYPLTSAEIQRYLIGLRTAPEEIENTLPSLPGLCFMDGFYSLPGRENLVKIRLRRQAAAALLWKKALRYGKFIANLPFVRSLAVTGSLSMNNVEQDADIDYLVITAPGRLWTCRALILGVVRLAGTVGVRLCPNYLVSQQSLVFPDQSLYTAHELTQMIPLSGFEIYAAIRRLNPWTEPFLPNADGSPEMTGQDPEFQVRLGLQSALESGFNFAPGSWFERWEMERKIRQLSWEQSASPESKFSADFCKGHLNQHAHSTENLFRQRLASLSLEVGP